MITFAKILRTKKGPLPSVAMYEPQLTEVIFKPNCFLSINAANPRDKLKPVEKSAWRYLSPVRILPDCVIPIEITGFHLQKFRNMTADEFEL